MSKVDYSFPSDANFAQLQPSRLKNWSNERQNEKGLYNSAPVSKLVRFGVQGFLTKLDEYKCEHNRTYLAAQIRHT